MRWLGLLFAIGSSLAAGADDAWLVHVEEGHRLQGKGHYREALKSYGKALKEASTDGTDRRAVATARNGLGVTLLLLGDFRQAETQLRQSLDAFEAATPGKPESARVLLNLVTALRYQKRFAEAEEANRRATAILEIAFGPGHPEVAASLNNRGELLYQMSRCGEAAALFERAQTLWEAALGPEHPASATTLNNLGIARYCLGEFREAQRLLLFAIQVRERVLPSGHPDIARSLYAYSDVLDKLGQSKEARKHKMRAQAIRARHATNNMMGMTIDATALR